MIWILSMVFESMWDALGYARHLTLYWTPRGRLVKMEMIPDLQTGKIALHFFYYFPNGKPSEEESAQFDSIVSKAKVFPSALLWEQTAVREWTVA